MDVFARSGSAWYTWGSKAVPNATILSVVN
jgi:hypothetical protein